MRLSLLTTAVLIFSLNFGLARENSSPEHVSAAAVIREINLARETPGLYAAFVAESRPFHMIEHGRAVDEGSHEDLLQREGLYKTLYELKNIDPALLRTRGGGDGGAQAMVAGAVPAGAMGEGPMGPM